MLNVHFHQDRTGIHMQNIHYHIVWRYTGRWKELCWQLGNEATIIYHEMIVGLVDQFGLHAIHDVLHNLGMFILLIDR